MASQGLHFSPKGFFSRAVSRVAKPLRVLRDRGYPKGVLPGLRQ